MAPDYRRIAVPIAGFCAFLNLYSPQALLPALSREFNVTAVQISAIMTASSFAVALTAPFTGAIADVLGRKRVITAAMIVCTFPMIMQALAPSVDALAFWRFVQGALSDLVGWRFAFATLAVLTLAGAVAIATLLPREKRFVRSEGLGASARQMLRHLRNPQLVATYAIGFGVLFNFIAVFTYVSFHLAAPPFNF